MHQYNLAGPRPPWHRVEIAISCAASLLQEGFKGCTLLLPHCLLRLQHSGLSMSSMPPLAVHAPPRSAGCLAVILVHRLKKLHLPAAAVSTHSCSTGGNEGCLGSMVFLCGCKHLAAACGSALMLL